MLHGMTGRAEIARYRDIIAESNVLECFMNRSAKWRPVWLTYREEHEGQVIQLMTLIKMQLKDSLT